MPGELRRASILTLHGKAGHALWRTRTTVLPGWLEEVERVWGRPHELRHSVRWARKLYRHSRDFDAVVSGSERVASIFALLQAIRRPRPVPHIFIECMWQMPSGRFALAMRRAQYRLQMRATSRIVVWSRRQVDMYSRVFRLKREKFVFLPYHTTFANTTFPPTEGNYIFAGGDTGRDYASLLEAVRDFPRRVIIAALRRDHFQGVKVPDNVEILTARPEQFMELLAGAWVVVVPLKGGLLHSGGQQTYLNAMALGKPVVVADDCGAEDYITHGQTGMLLKPGDPAGLRSALWTLLDNFELARLMAHEGQRVAEEHSPERFIRQVLALVDECVETAAHV
jgi:glycosyltransferase involved in cell wall biosynthesis